MYACINIYIYIYIYMHGFVCVYVYIYIYLSFVDNIITIALFLYIRTSILNLIYLSYSYTNPILVQSPIPENFYREHSVWFNCLILVLCIYAVCFAHSGSPSMLNLPLGILVGLVLGLVHSLLLSTGLKFPHFHFSLTFLFISPPPLPLLQPHTRLSRIHNWQVLIQSNH